MAGAVGGGPGGGRGGCGGFVAPGWPPAVGDAVGVDGVQACDDEEDDGGSDAPVHDVGVHPRPHTSLRSRRPIASCLRPVVGPPLAQRVLAGGGFGSELFLVFVGDGAFGQRRNHHDASSSLVVSGLVALFFFPGVGVVDDEVG